MPATESALLNDKLLALVERVWAPGPAGDSPVAVTVGTPPPKHLVVEQYAIVPNRGRSRYLVPVGSRRAAAASLWTYNTMRAPARRAGEAVLSALFRTPVTTGLFRDRLVVSIDRRVPPDRHSDWLIVQRLAQELNVPTLYACLAVRRVQPNSKPMLELYDAVGSPRGFSKLGWSEGTKSLVRAEFDALMEVHRAVDGVLTPKPLQHGRLGDREYSLVSPLPGGLRRYVTDPITTPTVPLAVARSAPRTAGALVDSAYGHRLRTTLTEVAGRAPEATRVLADWLKRLELVRTPLLYGRWHGDWMPHNLGRTRDLVAAWDWEHSRPDTPVGFDALHWHFQHGLARGGMDAAVSAVDLASRGLGTFAVPAAARQLTSSLYLLEMFLRVTVLAVGGGGWNPRIYPAMLQVAAGRDRDPAESPHNSPGMV